MSDWAAEEYRALPLEEIDVRYSRYRLSVLEAEEAMARSLRRYGQVSPIFAAHLNCPASVQMNCLATWKEEDGFLLPSSVFRI